MKIRDLVNEAKSTQQAASAINAQITQFSVNFANGVRNLDTEWYSGDVNISVELSNFPEEYLQNLRILCLIKPATDDDFTVTYDVAIPQWNYIIENIAEEMYVLRINVLGIADCLSKIKIVVINSENSYELRKPKF